MTPTDTSASSRTTPLGGVDQLTRFGSNDKNLKRIEDLSGTRLHVRDGELRIQGPPDGVARAGALVEHLIEITQTGSGFDSEDLTRFWHALEDAGGASLSRLEAGRVVIRGTQKIIKPKTPGQEGYLAAVAAHDIVVSIGPAGTGKTYLAVAM